MLCACDSSDWTFWPCGVQVLERKLSEASARLIELEARSDVIGGLEKVLNKIVKLK